MTSPPVISKANDPSCQDWFRLALVTVVASLISGLAPGQALFVPMLADWGVYSSLCKVSPNTSTNTTSNTSTNAPATCSAQQITISGIFTIVGGVCSCSYLLSGYTFDRYGGRRATVIGGILTLVGLLFLQVPMVGVLYDLDAYTSKVFLVAVSFTDVGNSFSMFAVLSFIYHFPKNQMVVTSLGAVVMQVSSLLPNIVEYVRDATGLPLPWIFGLYSNLVLISAILCNIIIPSHEEYLEKGKAFLPPGESDQMEASMRGAYKVLHARCLHHTSFFAVMSLTLVGNAIYGVNIDLYLRLLWNNTKKANDVTSLMTIMTGTFGAFAALIISYLADKLGRSAIYALAVAGIVMLSVMAKTITSDQQLDQLICAAASTLLMVVMMPMGQYYIVLHCPARLLGNFQGLMGSIIFGISLVSMIVVYALLAYASTSEQMGMLFACLFEIVALAFSIWVVRLIIVGIPEVVDPEKKRRRQPLLQKRTVPEMMSGGNLAFARLRIF